MTGQDSWRLQMLATPTGRIRSEAWPQRGRLTPETAAGLRQARREAGLSLGRVHALTGVSAGFLSELERGLKRPRMSTTEAILRVVPVDSELEEALRRESVVQSAYLPLGQRPPGWRPRVVTGADCGY